MWRCSSPARETVNGYDVEVNRSVAPRRSTTSRATSGVPSSEPLSTSTTCCTASNIGRQHPGQVACLVLDPEDAGQPRLERTVGPRPGDVVGRLALAVAQVGHRSTHRPRSRLKPLGSAAGSRAGAALSASGVGRGRGDLLRLVVELDVGLSELVEGRVPVLGVAIGIGESRQRLPALLRDLPEPRKARRGRPTCGGRGAGPGPRTGGPCACGWPRPGDRAQPELGPDPEQRDRPVGQQVVVPDEGAHRATRCALGVQHQVDPGRSPGRRTVTRTDDLGDVTQGGQVGRLRVAPHRRRTPEPEEPRHPRVLEDQLGLVLLVGQGGELGLQPVDDPGPQHAVGSRACRSRTTPRVGRRTASTLARSSSSVCRSTTHCDSADPRGPVSSAGTSGGGTCMPSACRPPASALVPLRPEPTTRTTRRLDTAVTLVGLEFQPRVTHLVTALTGPFDGRRALAYSARWCSAIRSAYQSKDRLGVRCWVS